MILEDLAYKLLPIFLELLLQSRWVVVVLSTTLILLCGEILPSAIFTGPHQLVLIHAMILLLNFLLWAMSPIAGADKQVLLVGQCKCTGRGKFGEGEFYRFYVHRPWGANIEI
jgi:metal transporter CNNM